MRLVQPQDGQLEGVCRGGHQLRQIVRRELLAVDLDDHVVRLEVGPLRRRALVDRHHEHRVVLEGEAHAHAAVWVALEHRVVQAVRLGIGGALAHDAELEARLVRRQQLADVRAVNLAAVDGHNHVSCLQVGLGRRGAVRDGGDKEEVVVWLDLDPERLARLPLDLRVEESHLLLLLALLLFRLTHHAQLKLGCVQRQQRTQVLRTGQLVVDRDDAVALLQVGVLGGRVGVHGRHDQLAVLTDDQLHAERLTLLAHHDGLVHRWLLLLFRLTHHAQLKLGCVQRQQRTQVLRTGQLVVDRDDAVALLQVGVLGGRVGVHGRHDQLAVLTDDQLHAERLTLLAHHDGLVHRWLLLLLIGDHLADDPELKLGGVRGQQLGEVVLA